MNDAIPTLQNLPMAKPQVGTREEELVLEVLRSGMLSLGPMGPRFERAFAEWNLAPFGSAVSSGTAGLHLAIRAAGIKPGDQVITSPLSFVASANVIIYEGATPVFADIDPKTLNVDPTEVADSLTDKTTGLLPVHLFGLSADMPAIERIAQDRDLWIVEDACEALGAVDETGNKVGARGNLAVFGFYPNKQLATGEGGMVLCANEDQKLRIDSERNQGRAPDMGWLDHQSLGFNYRLSDVAAAIGVAQLERLTEMLAARKDVAARYSDELSRVEGVTLPLADSGVGSRSWFVYVVQLPAGSDRASVMRQLAENGVASKPYMPVIHLQPYYRDKFGFQPGDFPIAEDVAERSLALPFFPAMTNDDVSRVVAELRSALEVR